MIARRIVGIDIGRHSIKAVQITSSFKRVEVSGIYRFPRRPPWREPLPLDRELLAFRGELPFSADRYIVGIPSSRVIFRHIRLPFSDRKKILSAARYEIEELIPFDVEQIEIDYLVRGTGPDENKLLILGIQKDVLNQYLDLLNQAGLYVGGVNLDMAALQGLLRWADIDDIQALAIVEIGASKTNLSIVRGGRIQLIRSLPIGGDDITAEISRTLGIPMEKAEDIKTSKLSIEPNIGRKPQDKQLRSCAHRILSSLIAQIDYTLAVHARRFEADRVNRIYLCGGSALLPGIERYMEEGLHIETSLLPPGPLIKDASLAEELRAQYPVDSLAMGLALSDLSRRRERGITFQKEEYGKPASRLGIREKMLALGGAMFLLMGLLIIDVNVRVHARQQRLERMKTEIRKIFQRAFPDVHTIVDAPLQMRRLIDEKKAEGLVPGAEKQPSAVLELIREIHLRLPVDLKLRLTELEIQEGTVELRGEAASFEVIERAKRALATSPLLDSPRVTDTRMNPRTRSVEFRMSIGKSKT